MSSSTGPRASRAGIVAGVLAAPLLALTDQSIAFALVGWSCAHQTTMLIHLAHAAFLLAAAACTWGAFRAWQAPAVAAGAVANGAAAGASQRRFLAAIAIAAALLSTAAIAAMWLPTWLIAACIA
jgi:hypothetical protein